MNDPILRDMHRVRAQRLRELRRDLRGALEESRRRVFTLGHDVVDLSSGVRRVVFKAAQAEDAPDDRGVR